MELDASSSERPKWKADNFTINLNFKSGKQGLRIKPFDKQHSTVYSILNEVKTASLART